MSAQIFIKRNRGNFILSNTNYKQMASHLKGLVQLRKITIRILKFTNYKQMAALHVCSRRELLLSNIINVIKTFVNYTF